MQMIDIRWFGLPLKFRDDVVNNYKFLTNSPAFSITATGISGYTEDGKLTEVTISITRNYVDELLGPFVTWLLEDKCRNLSGDSRQGEYDILKEFRLNLEKHPVINSRMKETIIQFPCPVENILIYAGTDAVWGVDTWWTYEQWCSIKNQNEELPLA